MIHPFLPARAGTLVALSTALLFTLFSSLLFSPGAAAQYFDDGRLTILITPSRFAETADETLAPVSVITREQIESSQADTVEEVLRTVPGVAFGNNGGVGKATSLFLRGANSNHVLVLIDGVKIGSATTGLAPFGLLPLDQIERIEVVRGPRSSLYGSEAIGGVVQIFTRKGQGETRRQFAASAGSHNSVKANAGASGGGDAGWFNVSVSHHSTDGYDACVTSSCGFDKTPDDDGYDNQAVSLRGGWNINDDLRLEANLLNSQSENDYDASYYTPSFTQVFVEDAVQEHTLEVLDLRANWRNARGESSLSVSRSEDDSENLYNGERNSVFNTVRNQLGAQHAMQIGAANKIIGGIDHLTDKIDGTTVYSVTERDNTGVYALYRRQGKINDWEISLRNDDNEQFGNHATGSVAWGFGSLDGGRLSASYGTGFQAPTLHNLYAPSYSNPDLEPEESKSVDIGFAYADQNSSASINFFHTTITGLLVYPAPNFIPMNVQTAKITGVELAMQQRLGPWQWGANFTLLNPQNEDSNTQLLRRPKSMVNFDVVRAFGNSSVGASLNAHGKSPDFGAVLDSYHIVNLRGETRLSDGWQGEFIIKNLFDEAYETAAGYPQDGRNYLFTLRYKPIPQ